MAYESIERLLSRRGEKVAAFMTVENAVGMAVLAGPFFVVGDLPILMRAVVIALAAVLGFLITTETEGMVFCERVLWRVRGELRLLVRGRTLTPDDLPGTRTFSHGHRAVAHGGIVRKSRRGRSPAAPIAVARSAQVQVSVVRRRESPHPTLSLLSEVPHVDRPA
jgi:hypothetical protein